MKRTAPYTSYILLFLFFFTLFNDLRAQLAIGEWRTHFSYNKIACVTGSADRILGASRAGIQIYDRESNSIETLDKVKGLSDIGITAIQHISEINTTIIGYENGNTDFLKENQITNYAGIKNAGINENKRINDIIYLNDRILLATDFGITEFNPSINQFGDTYYIVNGVMLTVYDLTTDDQYIYAATNQGVYFADYSQNLFLPSNWERIDDLPNYSQSFKLVEKFKGSLLAAWTDFSGEDVLYRLNDFSGSSVLISNNGRIESIYAGENSFYVATTGAIHIFNDAFMVSGEIENYPFGKAKPLDLYVSENEELWVGDEKLGLIRKSSGNQYEQILRNGPLTDQSFDIQSHGGRVYVSAGGYDQNLNSLDNTGMVYRFSEENWSTYQPDPFEDFTDILINQNNPSEIYVGSWSDGLFHFLDNELKNNYNAENSPLISSGNETKVHSLSSDGNGNIAMINHAAQNPLVIRQPDNEWILPDYEELEGRILEQILWAENNYIWGSFYNSSNLFVIDLNDTPANVEDDQVKILEPVDRQQKPYADEIYDIREDREGNIWISTNEGIGIVYDARFVFEGDIFQPDRPKITENDFTQYVLRDNIVHDIYVDPANRKWVATKNSGIMVFSPNAERLVSHFTVNNSPILSNTVNTLAMNEENGEIFMGTSEGIVSYRSKTSGAKDDFSETYVFPNPVRPGYDGPITITGLIDGVNIKITDISGNLVYETVSEGGQAIWYGKTLNGRKVSSGVYLVFITNEDGSKTHIEKILFIK